VADLSTVAPHFVEMAHRIVWCTVATVDPAGRPRTRILHPIWEWDGSTLTGWIATSPTSPKADHLAAHPNVSLTYWSTNHDVCTADCDAVFETDSESRHRTWDRFVNGPAPVGYDPTIVPGWENADSPRFGSLRLEPRRLRVMPGTVMLAGTGQLLNWRGEF
jgi:hypothetical protein